MTTVSVIVTDQPLFPTPAVGVITSMVPATMTVHDDGTRTVADIGDNAVWSQQPGTAQAPGQMGRRADPNTDGAYEQEHATLGHGVLVWIPGGGDVRAYVHGYVELS